MRRPVLVFALMLIHVAVFCGQALSADPVPDIKANGSDGLLSIEWNTPLRISVAFASESRAGENADWWLLADTPMGWYSYGLADASWRRGLLVTHQGPLFDLPLTEVLERSDLPVGSYSFYFGTDMAMNGEMDLGLSFYDQVDVMIDPITFEKTFGGPDQEYGYSVQETADGGFIIAGSTNSHLPESSDVYLVKTDASGNEEWSRTFGGVLDEYGYSVRETSDGGFIITGSKRSGIYFDVYLVKTDTSGNEVWARTFGGDGSERGRSVRETSDGGFIIAGFTTSFGSGGQDLYLLKTDADGNEEWSSAFGGASWEDGSSVQETADGGFIITGFTESFGAGSGDVYLVKTDADGSEEWSKTFGGVKPDLGNSVQETADGGFIIAGLTASFPENSWNLYLLKTDADGNEEWSRSFCHHMPGGATWNEGRSVQETSDGGFVIAGFSSLQCMGFCPPNSDIYLLKTDVDGNEQWSRTFGGEDYDWGDSVQETSDGGFVIGGHTASYGAGGYDFYLLKTDALGNLH